MSYTITEACTGCTACLKICPVTAISGERKMLHTIAVEMCVDCGACGRICPFHAVLDVSGQVCQMIQRSRWQQPIILEKKCVSCGVCLQICPTSVLGFAELTDHQVRAIACLMDPKNCIGCAFCESACPVEAIQMQDPALK